MNPYSPLASHSEYRHGNSCANYDTLFWPQWLRRLTLTYNLAQLVPPELGSPDGDQLEFSIYWLCSWYACPFHWYRHHLVDDRSHHRHQRRIAWVQNHHQDRHLLIQCSRSLRHRSLLNRACPPPQPCRYLRPRSCPPPHPFHSILCRYYLTRRNDEQPSLAWCVPALAQWLQADRCVHH